MSTSTNQITGTGFGYDANGNMTQDGLNTLTYDAANHLVTAGNGSSSGAYSYDGNGLRVKKAVPSTSPTTTTIYIFSGSKVIAEYDNGAGVSSPSREYVYSGSTMIAKIAGSTTTYYQTDHLSNRLVTNSSGGVVEQMGHFPFGEPLYDTGSEKLKFTTYERDAESGNDFAMARYDVNRLGRFSSPDPLAGTLDYPQSLNRYTYVLNDPLTLIDPTGRDCYYYDDANENIEEIDAHSSPKECKESGGEWHDPMAVQISVTAGNGSPDLVDQVFQAYFQQIQLLKQDLNQTPTSDDYIKAIAKGANVAGKAIPTPCGAGAFAYAGAEVPVGKGEGFVGGLAEADSRSGTSVSVLLEGEKNGKGAGGIVDTNGVVPIFFVQLTPVVGVVTLADSDGNVYFGVNAGGAYKNVGVGAGAYTRVTSVAGCQQ